MLFYRGNLEPISIPSDWLVARCKRTTPDVRKLEVADFGQTVRFGAYEAATDAILYEFDEDHRIRVKKQLRATDASIGGAVRRLRLQKGLRQSDFPGVSAREIARIELGKVKTPRAETLQLIAETAGGRSNGDDSNLLNVFAHCFVRSN